MRTRPFVLGAPPVDRKRQRFLRYRHIQMLINQAEGGVLKKQRRTFSGRKVLEAPGFKMSRSLNYKFSDDASNPTCLENSLHLRKRLCNDLGIAEVFNGRQAEQKIK